MGNGPTQAPSTQVPLLCLHHHPHRPPIQHQRGCRVELAQSLGPLGPLGPSGHLLIHLHSQHGQKPPVCLAATHSSINPSYYCRKLTEGTIRGAAVSSRLRSIFPLTPRDRPSVQVCHLPLPGPVLGRKINIASHPLLVCLRRPPSPPSVIEIDQPIPSRPITHTLAHTLIQTTGEPSSRSQLPTYLTTWSPDKYPGPPM